MTRILIRTGKRPGTYVGPEASLGYRQRGVFGLNLGNYFYWDATFRMVSVPGTEVVPDSLVSGSPQAAPEYIEKINDEFDAYVFTLTNSFRPDFVVGLKRWTALLKRLTIPVVGVGGGVQLGWDEGLEPGAEVDEATTDFVSTLLDHSASISVRGEVTAAYLRRLGFGDEHVRVTGCPSLYLYGPDYEIRPKGELTTDSKIAMTIAIRDYGFADFANRAFERYPNFMYIGQTGADLVTFLWGRDRLVDEMPDFPVHLGHPIMQAGRARMFLDARTWVDFLRDYDYMLGSRIHGNVAAILGGTPATLISMDKRTHELGEFHEIPTIRRPELKDDDTVVSVYERSDWTAFNKGLRGRYENFCRFFEENGIAHIGQPGKENPGYDEALAQAVLPPPVEPILREGELDPRAVLARLNWLRDGLNETAICEQKGHFVPEFPLITEREAKARRPKPPPPPPPPPPTVWQDTRRLGGTVLRRLGLRR